MKQKIRNLLCTLLLFGFISADFAAAQEGPQDVTIRDLNSYDNLTSFDQIDEHPLAGESVRFTAVLVSHPKTSGFASYDPDDNEIGRIHVFVTDTSAVNDENGRDGMSMQILPEFGSNAFSAFENRNRGDIVEITGALQFRNSEARVIPTEAQFVGNVSEEFYQHLAVLLDPVEVDLSDLHSDLGDGVFQLDLDAYQKYNGGYIKLNEASVSNIIIGTGDRDGRFDKAFNADGSRIYFNDMSLRYRNDRSPYRDDYNWRRVEEEGAYNVPNFGSVVNVSGFLNINTFNTDGHVPSGEGTFRLNPFEDGVRWVGDQRFEDGDEVFGEILNWPNDLEIIASPVEVLQISLSPEPEDGIYTDSDIENVTLELSVASPESEPNVIADSVNIRYTSSIYGEELIKMNETSSGNFELVLPELESFNSVSIVAIIYNSNGLQSRFPIAGSIDYFVDFGDPITSIETVQRTADNQVGPSPLVGLTDLSFDLTATVTSSPADGVIAIQQGKEPWSGIFLSIGPNTANLQRGDVINITSANVNEAEVANNSNTYTYLSNLSLTVTGSEDLTAVVPVLTTEEFNEPVAPGEAWEGMLVSFENVRMLNDQGFGEVSFASIVDGTDDTLPETVYFNWDTRAGAIGETGFPQDFNRHAILGSDLTSVTGLVTYTFGITKVIPRNLSDIQGENYTVPRPLFGLTSPATGAEVGVFGGNDVEVAWQSFNPRDYDGDTVTFEWVLFGADSTEIVAVQSNNDGSSAQVTLPFDVVDGLLAELGVADGESVDVLWSVRASDGENTILKSNFLDGSEGGTTRAPGVSLFEAAYNELTLTRGEVTSNEEFAEGPRTFELQQNFPNPFNPTTQINYAVPQQSEVKIEVYNVLGRRVATLVDREMAPGNYTVNFDASSLSSGMYFYRLQAGSTLLTKKMTLIK